MGVQGIGSVLPAGVSQKKKLSGDVLTMKVLTVTQEGGRDDIFLEIPNEEFDNFKNDDLEKYILSKTGKQTKGKDALIEKGKEKTSLTIMGDEVESSFKNAIVQYPDGFQRHHQVIDLSDLLAKISAQLKGRYNLQSFAFSHVPQELASDTEIQTKENVYDA